MITYTTGNLLESDTEALVNTVNCEGYMGKGIAYQFKLKYPENNADYIKVCKNGSLKVGNLHYYREKNKLIINFPTKDKWRANSKIEYIVEGLDSLIALIEKLNIKSISIPPLGSGNGGLVWSEVKNLIEQKLSKLDNNVQVFIFEPSKDYVAQPLAEPKLSMSALVLMEIKKGLRKFDSLRLQKTAYFINIFSHQNYFKFTRHKFGPYDNSISIISKNIKEFRKYHNVNDVNELYKILLNKIVSDNVESKMSEILPAIKRATDYVNSIESNDDLECLATIVYLIDENKILTAEEIVEKFKLWSEDKANRFSEKDILNSISKLEASNIIEKNLIGYSLNKNRTVERLLNV